MSRGFIKEGDQEDVPMVPQRAYLPKGVQNFVTPEGLNQLMQERQSLMDERDRIGSDINENEQRIAVNHINARLHLLNVRISKARVIDSKGQPGDEVRFGARVGLRTNETDGLQEFRLVGVDEADVSEGKISFISPLARALMNRKAGERVSIVRAGQTTEYEIVSISYD